MKLVNKCVTGKKMYASHTLGEDALIDAWTTFHYSPGNGPVAVYLCDDCGYYHFTSKGTMNDRLSTLLAEGKIQRLREANRWADKWKNK